MKKTGKSFVLAGLLLAGIVSVAGAGEMMPVPGSAGDQGAAVAAGQGLFSGRMNGNETARETAATIRDRMAVQREQGLKTAQERQRQALGQACDTVEKTQQAGPMAGSFQNHGAAGLRGQAIRPEVRVRRRFR
ncbi:MAG TPA: hypothetical protein ENG79_05530 [Desulfobacteraceae bacterium]|nr:hypothetical protein [Desulfobacteraceae bacterium]